MANWSSYASVSEVYRRASGRRQYNSVRSFRVALRRWQEVELLKMTRGGGLIGKNCIQAQIAGTRHQQWVRCGRENCRCANGDLHGPYLYRFYREGGRLRKAYVKRADVAAVMAACRARQDELQREREFKLAVREQIAGNRVRW